MNYRLLRNLHLLSGLIALPFLLMYGISAVQMAHNKWFDMKPRHVWIPQMPILQPGITDATEIARQLHLEGDIRGSLPRFRVVRPGAASDVSYDSRTGQAKLTTTELATIGFLNRLHHSAGLWPGYFPLKLWGVAIGFVSLGVVLLALTGLLLWWQRKQDRRIGLVLFAGNVIVALVLLALIRSAGP